MKESGPRGKGWRHRRLLSEHAFPKLRELDCTFSEFALAVEDAEIIDEEPLENDQTKELLLTGAWKRPLHVVVVVDDARREERIVTIYEPDPSLWSDGLS